MTIFNSLTLNKSLLIDYGDTIKFNFSEGIINVALIDIPISFSSDENIYSIDFSFKYNIQEIEVDSIINLTPGLQYLYHYNTSDSTFRFTSNSLSPLLNDTPVILIRFFSSLGLICAQDINTETTYLNGDQCSNQSLGCVISSQQEYINSSPSLSVYPNPFMNEIFYSAKNDSAFDEIIITDLSGKLIRKVSTYSESIVNTQSLTTGVYFLEFHNKSTGDRKRVKMVKAGVRN